jgi:hypothetical protein
VVINCYGENIRNIPASEYSEERLRHYAFIEAYFGGKDKPTHHILCDDCGGELHLTAHYDFGGTRPRRQAICSKAGCRRTCYVVC